MILIEKIKTFFSSVAQTSGFVLNSTLIAIPYLLFLRLVDGKNPSTIFPLVIFYTFRMTGVFLLRSIKIGMGSYSVLVFTLILGFTGALFGVLGNLYAPLYILSGIFLGLSTGFIKPIYTTITFHKREEPSSSQSGKKYAPILFSLVVLLVLTALPGTKQISFVMLFYMILFALAIYSTTRDTDYHFKLIHLKDATVSLRQSAIFIVFFILLILLRTARLSFDAKTLDIAALGFTIVFLIAVTVIGLRRKHIKLPLWLNVLSLANGMCGNFIFIFGSFYVGIIYGNLQATTHLYVPFVLGMIFAMAFAGKVQKLFKNLSPITVQLSGMCLSLVLLITPFYFPVSVFLISFFYTGTSSWLNKEYYQIRSIPYDRRLISKFSMQNVGSITYQFIVVVLILIAFQYYQVSTGTFFTFTENVAHPQVLTTIIHTVKNWGCLILLALFAIAFIGVRRNRKTMNGAAK